MNPKIYIGCSGFFNRHWKGIFYPQSVRQKDWFAYYAEHFNTLEINTTFYKFPEPERLAPWYNQSPPDFLFTVKAPRLITHFKKLNECERLFDDFYNACTAGLQEKLGCVLFQFPPLFQFSEERLDLLTCSLRKEYKNVVEFRHVSWWNEDVYHRLRNAGISFVTPSHPTMPDQLVTTSPLCYLRFHGKEKMFYSYYSYEELLYARKMVAHHPELEEVWIYFNNTASTAGILNALEMKNLFSL